MIEASPELGGTPACGSVEWHTCAIAIAGGCLTFYFYPVVHAHKRDALFFDAIGLAVFAVTRAQKALQYGIDPVMAAGSVGPLGAPRVRISGHPG